MIYLGDYVGQILSEVSIARSQADLEAIRIAELYANHDLLKYFPVPRVRIKDVEVDLPVVVVEAESPPDGENPRGGVNSEILPDLFTRVLDRQLQSNDLIKLSRTERTSLLRSIRQSTDFLKQPNYIQANTNIAVDEFSSILHDFILERKPELEVNAARTFVDEVRKLARIEFVNARSGIPRIMVGVASREISEAHNDSVVRISLKLVEEGLEWTHISTDDGKEGRFQLVRE